MKANDYTFRNDTSSNREEDHLKKQFQIDVPVKVGIKSINHFQIGNSLSERS